jgi:hypothetical protein
MYTISVEEEKKEKIMTKALILVIILFFLSILITYSQISEKYNLISVVEQEYLINTIILFALSSFIYSIFFVNFMEEITVEPSLIIAILTLTIFVILINCLSNYIIVSSETDCYMEKQFFNSGYYLNINGNEQCYDVDKLVVDSKTDNYKYIYFKINMTGENV